MRAPEPPPVLADCKGLSVTAAFYWAKGKQQDSAWGPIKDYSSWKSALAHGPEYARALIFRAVGAHSIFTSCATLAGTAAHADAVTHAVGLMLRLTQGWLLMFTYLCTCPKVFPCSVPSRECLTQQLLHRERPLSPSDVASCFVAGLHVCFCTP